jgi:hypothetical protein
MRRRPASARGSAPASALLTTPAVDGRRRRIAFSLSIVLVCALGCGGEAPPPFAAVADTHTLMHAVVEPSADVIWDAVQTIITEAGVEEIRPRTDEEWDAVRSSAVTLAESGNLLMMPPRAKDGDWMRSARALIDTGTSAIEAIDAKDADQLFEVGGHIYSVCTSCHAKYWDEQRVGP